MILYMPTLILPLRTKDDTSGSYQLLVNPDFLLLQYQQRKKESDLITSSY
jgi:hypothetical protein